MTISHTRSRKARIAALAAAGIGLALVLTGCVKVDASLDINSDAKASGTFSLALQKQAANMLGMTDLDAFASGITQDQGSDILTTGDCTPSETDTDFVYSCTFTDTAFTEADGPWQISKDGSTIVFTMTGTASQDDSSDQLLGDASLGTMKVDVTFPGAISDITGAEKTSDTTATVSGSLNDAFNVKIVSAASGGSNSTIVGYIAKGLVVLLALLVLALIVVVAVVLIRRRRQPAVDSSATYVVPPPAPGAAPGDGGAPTVAGIALAEASMAETAVSEPVATQAPTEPAVVTPPPAESAAQVPPPPAEPPAVPAQPAEPAPPAPEAPEEPTPPA